MARRGILSEYGPERTMGAQRLTGLSRPGERDVNDYQPPTRVKTPYDPKGVGLHGDSPRRDGAQGGDYGSCQSSGGPGLGGDAIRPAGSQGRR